MPVGVLYLGDTDLGAAAGYLAGLIERAGWALDYLPTFTEVSRDLIDVPRRLFILSDFTAACFPDDLQRNMLQQVADGAGLVMIGGWESYRGQSGHWAGTPVAEALPVVIGEDDDRVNCDRPTFVYPLTEHPILEDLPWATRPPLIGGYNRLAAKPDATVLAEARTYDAGIDGLTVTLIEAGRDPLLIVGAHGKGRVVSLATDAAPHWVGPMVDWGAQRVVARSSLPGAIEVEVGDCYAKFFTQLLRWAAPALDPEGNPS